MEIKEAIKILRELIDREKAGYYIDPKNINTLTFVMQFLSKINDAEMPKKKVVLSTTTIDDPKLFSKQEYADGYNQCHDDFLAYHLRKITERVNKEKLLVLMLNKIPSKYHNNPDKIKEFGDMFEDIIEAIAKEIKEE